jgi:hypothetical protein
MKDLSFVSKVMDHIRFGFAAGCEAAKPKLALLGQGTAVIQSV